MTCVYVLPWSPLCCYRREAVVIVKYDYTDDELRRRDLEALELGKQERTLLEKTQLFMRTKIGSRILKKKVKANKKVRVQWCVCLPAPHCHGSPRSLQAAKKEKHEIWQDYLHHKSDLKCVMVVAAEHADTQPLTHMLPQCYPGL